MIEAMLDQRQKKLRNEVREFVKAIPRQLILDMDADKVKYPRQFLEEAARRKLLGLRFPKAVRRQGDEVGRRGCRP